MEYLAPKPQELKKFSAQFTKEEWSVLCQNEVFMASLELSLARSAFHATQILKRPIYLVPTAQHHSGQIIVGTPRWLKLKPVLS